VYGKTEDISHPHQPNTQSQSPNYIPQLLTNSHQRTKLEFQQVELSAVEKGMPDSSWQSSEVQDASSRIEMGNPN